MGRMGRMVEFNIRYIIGRKILFFEFIYVIRCLNMQVSLYILYMFT